MNWIKTQWDRLPASLRTWLATQWGNLPAPVRAWLADTSERVAATWWQAFAATMIIAATTGGITLSATSAAFSAGVAAGLAVLKAAIAALLPTRSPASWLPRGSTPPKFIHVEAPQGRLPTPSGRKHGAIPSPRDDRDHVAELPTVIPSSIDNGAGLTFGMLLNDRIGDCYPAALLHALQVLSGGKYTPTDADALNVYKLVTGYDPTRTDANGYNPTDRGTVGRQLLAWAKAHGLIGDYAAVPALDPQSIRAAIAARKVVLCEWALPVGAESEGDNWSVPRTGRAAGSWGYHATCEVGYTTARTKNVTWGAEGTVTYAFETAYLQAAWVITAPAVIPPIPAT